MYQEAQSWWSISTLKQEQRKLGEATGLSKVSLLLYCLWKELERTAGERRKEVPHLRFFLGEYTQASGAQPSLRKTVLCSQELYLAWEETPKNTRDKLGLGSS